MKYAGVAAKIIKMRGILIYRLSSRFRGEAQDCFRLPSLMNGSIFARKFLHIDIEMGMIRRFLIHIVPLNRINHINSQSRILVRDDRFHFFVVLHRTKFHSSLVISQ